MQIFQSQIDEIVSLESRQEFGTSIDVEAMAVRGIEDEGCDRSSLEGGPVLPTGRIGPVTRERLKRRLRQQILDFEMTPNDK